MINEYNIHDEWKMHLTMTSNFVSSKDSDETRTMHTKTENIEM